MKGASILPSFQSERRWGGRGNGSTYPRAAGPARPRRASAAAQPLFPAGPVLRLLGTMLFPPRSPCSRRNRMLREERPGRARSGGCARPRGRQHHGQSPSGNRARESPDRARARTEPERGQSPGTSAGSSGSGALRARPALRRARAERSGSSAGSAAAAGAAAAGAAAAAAGAPLRERLRGARPRRFCCAGCGAQRPAGRMMPGRMPRRMPRWLVRRMPRMLEEPGRGARPAHARPPPPGPGRAGLLPAQCKQPGAPVVPRAAPSSAGDITERISHNQGVLRRWNGP